MKKIMRKESYPHEKFKIEFKSIVDALNDESFENSK
jgi:hypothetical protein